ncbi:MAG: lysylphosphatidylglycerol synthase transmembrane domain-containing protein, partial [Pirellulales bacterium]
MTDDTILSDAGPEDGPPASNVRSWLFFAAKVLIFAAVAWGVRGTLTDGVEQLRHADFTLRWNWLALSAAVYVVANLPCGWFWWYSMQKLGQRSKFYRAFRAYVIGHLGKYAPGKALVVILRAGFIRSETTDGGVAAACVFLETLTLMASGAALSAIVLAFSIDEHLWFSLLALGLAAITFGPTWPSVFRYVVRRIGVGRRDPEIDGKLRGLNARLVAAGWFSALVTWVLYGVSLWAVLMGIGIDSYSLPESIVTLTATSALAVVAGFASLIPGGFGVRDVVLIEMLGPFLEAAGVSNVEAAALSTAVLLRLVWLVAELAGAA